MITGLRPRNHADNGDAEVSVVIYDRYLVVAAHVDRNTTHCNMRATRKPWTHSCRRRDQLPTLRPHWPDKNWSSRRPVRIARAKGNHQHLSISRSDAMTQFVFESFTFDGKLVHRTTMVVALISLPIHKFPLRASAQLHRVRCAQTCRECELCVHARRCLGILVRLLPRIRIKQSADATQS